MSDFEDDDLNDYFNSYSNVVSNFKTHLKTIKKSDQEKNIVHAPSPVKKIKSFELVNLLTSHSSLILNTAACQAKAKATSIIQKLPADIISNAANAIKLPAEIAVAITGKELPEETPVVTISEETDSGDSRRYNTRLRSKKQAQSVNIQLSKPVKVGRKKNGKVKSSHSDAAVIEVDYDNSSLEVCIPSDEMNSEIVVVSSNSRLEECKKTSKVSSTKKRINVGNMSSETVSIDDSEVFIDDDFDKSLLNVTIPDDEINYETTVKVIWKSVDVVRIPIRRMQKLNTIYEHFVKKENVGREQIILTLNGATINPNDTPDSLNLGVLDFIEGGIVSRALSSGPAAPSVSCKSGFCIKFQNNNKVLVLSGQPSEQMKVFMARYAEQIEKPLESLKFYFDGLLIKSSQTPIDLELENNDIVDVTVS